MFKIVEKEGNSLMWR